MPVTAYAATGIAPWQASTGHRALSHSPYLATSGSDHQSPDTRMSVPYWMCAYCLAGSGWPLRLVPRSIISSARGVRCAGVGSGCRLACGRCGIAPCCRSAYMSNLRAGSFRWSLSWVAVAPADAPVRLVWSGWSGLARDGVLLAHASRLAGWQWHWQVTPRSFVGRV